MRYSQCKNQTTTNCYKSKKDKMNDFEVNLTSFWKKVQTEYSELVKVGGVAENRDFYLFQTGYHHNPDLMIVGINPGGDGLSGKHWLCPENNLNMYITGSHDWFKTVRSIFGYPQNEILKPVLENSMGSNKVFINTGYQNKNPKSELSTFGPDLIRELVKIVQPEHIIALGVDVFYSLRTGKVDSKKFGKVYLKHGFSNGKPICFIPNPSSRNRKYFNNEELLHNWQEAIEWFIML
jgi:uracil-DNA glycosylase